MLSAGHRPPIVAFTIIEWGGLQQRPHHLLRGLAAQRPVAVVNNPYYSLFSYLRDRHDLADHPRQSLYQRHTEQDSLHILSLPSLLPGASSSLDRARFNAAMMAPLLREFIRELNGRQPILWCSYPYDLAFISQITHCGLIYDCMDRHGSFTEKPGRGELVRAEARLIRQADLVLAASGPLLEDCLALNPSSRLVRNGVTDAFFCSSRGELPPALQGLSRPRLGFVGTLDHWLDQEAIIAMARAFPQATLVLIGPARCDLSALAAEANIRLIGELPFASMPACIAAFDVCLIPFRISDLTRAVNPVKLYEYFALGKPVVAARLPELEPFKDLCFLAEHPEDYLDGVRLSLEEQVENDSRRRDERIRIAGENRWSRRVAEIGALIDERFSADLC